MVYRFSIFKAESIWDEEQWSEEYSLEDIPENFKDERFMSSNSNIQNIINKIKQIIP